MTTGALLGRSGGVCKWPKQLSCTEVPQGHRGFDSHRRLIHIDKEYHYTDKESSLLFIFLCNLSASCLTILNRSSIISHYEQAQHS